jgi:integrase
MFKRLLKKADLPDMRFHDLRHTAATIFLMMNVPPKVVQEILGHATVKMTMEIYGHVFPAQHDEAMDKMDSFLTPLVQ